jgi:hypothetical protein
MTPEEGNQVAYSIYQQIFGSLTSPAAGQPAVFDAPSTYLCLELPAQAISVKDFANPWTPANTSGDKDAARNLADLVDSVPAFSPRYVPTGKRISEIYGNIVNGARVKAPPMEAEWQEQYDESYAKLYRTVKQTDPETGEVTERVVPTTLWQNYKRNKAAYNAAQVAYAQAFIKAQATPEGRETWPMLGPALEQPVRDAFDQLEADGADELEATLAAHARAQSNLVGQAFQDAQFLFNNYGVNLGGAAGERTWRASLRPSDWFDPNGAAGWTHRTSDHSDFTANSSSDATSWGGKAGVNMGLWSVGASAGGSETREHSDTDFSSVSIDYWYTLVSIDRPWENQSLLSLSNWDMADMYPAGGISAGPDGDNASTAWPLLPVAFIAIKDLKITAAWGESDRDRLEKSLTAGGSVGYGPFSLSGSYSHSSTNEHYHSSFDGDSVEVPTVQIIGWVCQVNPFAPPTGPEPPA